jgi:hypothetical protein
LYFPAAGLGVLFFIAVIFYKIRIYLKLVIVDSETVENDKSCNVIKVTVSFRKKGH